MPHGVVILNEYTTQLSQSAYWLGIFFILIGFGTLITACITHKLSDFILSIVVGLILMNFGDLSYQLGKQDKIIYEVYFTENVNMVELLQDYKIIKIDGITAHITELNGVREYEVE